MSAGGNSTAPTANGGIVALCACCEEATAWLYDEDLDALVCDNCQTDLRWAKAWLIRAARARGCVRSKHERGGTDGKTAQ